MFHENSPVQSVAKALRLLGLLMEAHQPLTLAALSKQTGWPKSTIHGLLSTKRESAVVDQQSDGRYCLGVRLFEYGCAVEEGEYRFGLCSPSAPVRDSSGAVRYAVGVVGMFDSVRSPDFQRDIDLTCAAAAQISTVLGYRA